MEPGEMASPQKPVFSLAIIDPKWVRAYVSEPDLGKVRTGMRARSRSTAFRPRFGLGRLHLAGRRVHAQRPCRPRNCDQPGLRGPGLRQGSGRSAARHAGDGASAARRKRHRIGCRPDESAATLPIVGRDIHKTFRRDTGEVVRALDGVSLEARHGTLTALVGPDGAGKTTLDAAGRRADERRSRQLEVLGIDVAAHPQEVQARIGYMPQRFGLYEDLSVQENLDLYADLHGVSAAERERTIRG